jgi:hypothetical protein
LTLQKWLMLFGKLCENHTELKHTVRTQRRVLILHRRRYSNQWNMRPTWKAFILLFSFLLFSFFPSLFIPPSSSFSITSSRFRLIILFLYSLYAYFFVRSHFPFYPLQSAPSFPFYLFLFVSIILYLVDTPVSHSRHRFPLELNIGGVALSLMISALG